MTAAEAFESLLDSESLWEGHLLEPGNVFKQVGYFVSFPTWWRRFVFRVLEPRDIAVYVYVCSYMSNQQSSRPTIQTIANDLGNSNRHGVTTSLSRLVERGFFLRKKMASLMAKDSRHPRYIYQRPSIEYTLFILLTQGLINGYLQVTSKTLRPQQETLPGKIDSRLAKALVTPLKKLLGDRAFAKYAKLQNETRKRKFLIEQLDELVEAMRTEAKASGKI